MDRAGKGTAPDADTDPKATKKPGAMSGFFIPEAESACDRTHACAWACPFENR
jgi:hypothetical protein